MLKTAMAKVYYKMVKEGKMTLDQVPEQWREEVAKMLGVSVQYTPFTSTPTQTPPSDGLIAHRPK